MIRQTREVQASIFQWLVLCPIKWKPNLFLEIPPSFFCCWSTEFLLSDEWDWEDLSFLCEVEARGEADCDLSVVSQGEFVLTRELELDLCRIVEAAGLPARTFGEDDLPAAASSSFMLGWEVNTGLVRGRRAWQSDWISSGWARLLLWWRESWDWRDDWEEKVDSRSLHGVLRLLRPAPYKYLHFKISTPIRIGKNRGNST